jgi:hypothetical protein
VGAPSLIALERRIREILVPEHSARPFLCNGSPLECSVAIVGINPGTDTPFWDFWTSDAEFDKDGWLAAFYTDERNRRNQTRPRIEVLVTELLPLRCLELNIYPYWSKSEATLLPNLRDTAVFTYMLSMVRPKLLFVFGRTPTTELAAALGVSPFPWNEFTQCAHDGRSFDVFATSHLSRGWSMQRVAALGRRLKARLHA